MRTQSPRQDVPTAELPHPVTPRGRALLTAVAHGRVDMSCSCEPDLFIDGLYCCDQSTAHTLAHDGLIAPVTRAPIGSRVHAVLTPAGTTALEMTPA